MKKLVLPLSFFALISGTQFFAQTSAFSNEFASVRSDLVSWDKVRGEWLAQSMEAMSTNQPVPDRNFPENFTPSQMFMAMPENVRSSIRTKIAQQSTSSVDSSARQQWSAVNQFVQRPTCSAQMARTYGDPHLKSFDGADFDFQTVGEFTLVKSQSGHMIVQARQRAEGTSVSLNSAVAMWVNGDRVCFYASNLPDGNRSTPIRVEGEPVYLNNGNYFLNHGGTITQSKSQYVVTWPTGERVLIDPRGFGNGDFYNLAVEVFPCNDSYSGVLGNANGRSNDDFDINGRQANFGGIGGGTMERQYLDYLSREFADEWRVRQPESLFDYGFGQSTETFTDRLFPTLHHTINDLPTAQRDRARRDCERMGFTGADLNACIYDNGFVRIPPTAPPVVPPVTTGGPITPVVNPVPNVNPGGRIASARPTKNPGVDGTGNTGSTSPIRVENTGGTVGSGVQPDGPLTGTTTKENGVDPNAGSHPITQGGGSGTVGKETVGGGSGTTSGTTTTTTTTKQPNPYEPPVEPEKPRWRVPTTTTTTKQPSSSGSSSSGSSGSSSGSSSGRTSSPSTSSPRPVSTPSPRPVSTPSPKPVSSPAPSTPSVSKPTGTVIRKP